MALKPYRKVYLWEKSGASEGWEKHVMIKYEITEEKKEMKEKLSKKLFKHTHWVMWIAYALNVLFIGLSHK